MHRREALAAGLSLLVLAGLKARSQSIDEAYLRAGKRALEWTRRLVEIGPRPPGTEAHRKQQALIARALRQLRCKLIEERFTAETPEGAIAMNNLIAQFRGTSGRVVVVSGHYDTYHRQGLSFVGANDGGSSAGFLLALAEILEEQPTKDDVWLVFFDGEESFRKWSGNDHTYGSRHQAAKWSRDGTLDRIKALINVDMIGDADLALTCERHSTAWLRNLVWNTAKRLGYGEVFSKEDCIHIEDDHVPFVEAGVSAVDLIDFEYGSFNRYWHTEQDTLDKLSPRSFTIILQVVSEVLRELEKVP